MIATAIRGINGSYVAERIVSPPLVRSCTAIYPATEVSFSKTIHSFAREGRTFLNACGIIMYIIV